MNYPKDEEYLDKEFPKGSKKRGNCMVLLALAREEGRQKMREEVIEFLNKRCVYCMIASELKKKIGEGK